MASERITDLTYHYEDPNDIKHWVPVAEMQKYIPYTMYVDLTAFSGMHFPPGEGAFWQPVMKIVNDAG